MDDPLLVCNAQCICKIGNPLGSLERTRYLPFESMEKVFYFDVLANDKDRELRNTTNLEDGNDVGVFESCDCACFLDVEISVARSFIKCG